jgi:uncharacterized protein YbjT (DUF2867 family)
MTLQTDSKRSAAVFGATGLVGKEVIAELLDNSNFNKIMAIARKPLSFSDPKFEHIHLAGFSELMDLKEKLKTDVYFCCIGTTIKKAGSQEAFKKVDLDIPLKIAQLAQALSVHSLVIVSSIGANPESSNFYLRTKGEMEENVKKIFKGNLKFVHPSLLMGNRDEFRFGEKIAIIFMKIFGWLFAGPIKKYRGISARDVARAMIKISGLAHKKMVYESDEMLELLSSKDNFTK